MKKALLSIALISGTLSLGTTIANAHMLTQNPTKKVASGTYKYSNGPVQSTIVIKSDNTYYMTMLDKSNEVDYDENAEWEMYSDDIVILKTSGEASDRAYKIKNGNLIELHEDLTENTDENGNKIIYKKVK